MRFDFSDGFVNVIARHPEVLGFVPSNLTKEGPMLSRRSVLLAAVAVGAAIAAPASAAGPQPFNDAAFAAAQKAGKPIFVAIHASWCPTCQAQKPILAELMADPKFKDLAYFTIDFDSQKDLVRRFGARMQSTLISFKGATEQGRSVGDTNRQSIAALLNKVL
jgi:thiol-disulfide isomerase/thioredoxin